jgi:hypothetical protein
MSWDDGSVLKVDCEDGCRIMIVLLKIFKFCIQNGKILWDVHYYSIKLLKINWGNLGDNDSCL